MAAATTSNTKADWLKERISCAMCLDIFDRPHTLTCLHTLCKGCIDDLKPYTKDSSRGYMCPLCDQFCPADRVRPNVLIKELLDFYDSLNISPTNHCTTTISDDWQTPMAETHHVMSSVAKHPSSHSNASPQQHHIFIDHPMPCPKHPDTNLELNCITCEQLMCIHCRSIEHAGHPCETVDDALERIRSRVLKAKVNIENAIAKASSIEPLLTEKAKGMHGDIDVLESEARDMHRKRSRMLDDDLNNLLGEIHREREHLKILEEKRLHIAQNHMNDAKHVIQCVATAIATAKGVPLLKELNSGMRTNLNQMEQETKRMYDQISVRGHIDGATAGVTPLKLVPQSIEENMIGNLVPIAAAAPTGGAAKGHKDVRPKSKSESSHTKRHGRGPEQVTKPQENKAATMNDPKSPIAIRHETSKRWHFPLQSLVNKDPKLQKSMSFIDRSYSTPHAKCSVMNGQIWTLHDGDFFDPTIRVFTQEFKKVRTIKLPAKLTLDNNTANAIAQYQSHSLIAVASDRGLYTVSADSHKMLKTLQPGKFADVCIVEGQMYAYEYTESRIYIFQAALPENDDNGNDATPLTNTWQYVKMIQHDHIPNNDHPSRSTIAVTTNPTNTLYVYNVGSIVTKYNIDDGSKLGRYGTVGTHNKNYGPGGLHCATLCGCDSGGNLVVCCPAQNKIQALSPTGKWFILMDNTMTQRIYPRKYFMPHYAASLDSTTFCILADFYGDWKLLIYSI